MARWCATRFVLLILLLLTTPAAAEVITVAPAVDDKIVLHNPDMGWVLYENFPVDPNPSGSSTLLTMPAENFDGVDHVAIMFTWADVERRPGEYDFGDVNHAYDYWKQRGKQIQLRMSTESLMWWENAQPSRGVGVPRHVLEKIPPSHKQRRKEFGIEYDVVDGRDEIYLAALDKFLAAVAKNYSDARPVTLIDLRGFGLWGEWHSGFRYSEVESRRAALTKIIDHWSAALPNHQLSLSYSHDPDGPKEFFDGPNLQYDAAFAQNYDKFLAYSAFDHAMTKPNITWRRDGVGGAVYSNQRRLCEEEFAKLTRGPFMCEFVDGYADSKRGGQKWLEKKIDDAFSQHPNYINLLGWQGGDAQAFMKEQPELFQRGLREMGYRLVPTKVSYPEHVTPGGGFKIEMTWENRGVGRALRDYHLKLIVGDQQIDAGPIETSRWIKGRNYAVAKDVKLPAIAAGAYPLHIALVDPATGQPIALPLKDGAVGTITVRGD
ncbi:MAG: hypothetical protein QOF78_4127 [Phycisphaerales bacterium]|nr:hypothetical protein [Phycisphaerales bacterium]